MTQSNYNEFGVRCVELEMQGEIPIFKVEKKGKDGEMHFKTYTTVEKN